MPNRIIVFVLAILIVPAAFLLSTGSSFAERAADDCLTKPGSTAPQGRHWFYRLDRAAHRECWYLGPEGGKTRAAARPEPEMRVPTTKPLSPPNAPLLAGAGPAGVAPLTIGTATTNPLVRRPDNVSRPTTSEPAPLDDSDAGARMPDQQDDMPLIWPVLTAGERGASAPQLAAAIGSKWLLAILAGALAVAGFSARLNFKRSPARPLAREAAVGRFPHERVPPTSTGKPAAVSLADFINSSNRATRPSHFAPPPRPWSANHFQESKLRRQVARAS
jgi:hypothetical protein